MSSIEIRGPRAGSTTSNSGTSSTANTPSHSSHSSHHPDLSYLNPTERFTPSSSSCSFSSSSSSPSSGSFSSSTLSSHPKQPLCFDPSLLNAPTFDPHTFVSQCLSIPPLPPPASSSSAASLL